jgi:hypothetical protein
MKALTIRQPWVWAILEAGKRIENRPRVTHYRGPVYIHAGVATPNWQPLADVESRCGRYPDPEVLDYGVIVAKAEIVACVWSDVMAPPWGEPQCYHWHLDNVRRLRKPIAVRGQLGLWNYP